MRSRRSRVKKAQAVDQTAQSSGSVVGRGGPNIKAEKQTSLRLVREMLVQRKLSVSEPGDRFEQEADRVADSVMRMSGPIPSIQRMCSDCDEEMEGRHTAWEQRETPAVQRVCYECEEEAKAAIEEEEDEFERVSAKPMHAGRRGPTFMDSSAIDSLAAGGHPLPRSTRSFFESRMGHDFGQVRIHHDARADELAQSVNARAFTRANHLVFRMGEYQPDTASGRHLLAHELAHTVQQGASPSATRDATQNGAATGTAAPANSVMPAIQLACQVTTPPSDMTCPPATSSAGSGTPIRFGQDSFTIAATDLPTLSAIAAAWHTGGEVDVLRIDGFASCDGPASHNWRLSCNRAEAVRAELEAPSDGSPGVDPAFLDVVANGETNVFSPTSFPPNRRVMISTGGIPPPGPPCPLAITGPDEVDHYCAAYVPSDAPSCPTFPAPAITLTVTGAAPGATLTWRIARGSAQASIVGAITGTTVDIQGDAPSGTQGDVTVHVSDGTCTATHALTVREPTSMVAAQAPSRTATVIRNTITYTVLDQFGNPMGANICLDETVTVCSDNHPELGAFRFGDAPTNAAGQATDNLATPLPTTPPPLCTKLDQTITAGGCGPLLHNTILFQPSGVTLNHNDSCAVGDPCP